MLFLALKVLNRGILFANEVCMKKKKTKFPILVSPAKKKKLKIREKRVLMSMASEVTKIPHLEAPELCSFAKHQTNDDVDHHRQKLMSL